MPNKFKFFLFETRDTTTKIVEIRFARTKHDTHRSQSDLWFEVENFSWRAVGGKVLKMSRKNVILSESEMSEKVRDFREWIKTQPDLPQNIGTARKY